LRFLIRFAGKRCCPDCNQEIDETEFMGIEGMCVMCYENKQNLFNENKITPKENI